MKTKKITSAQKNEFIRDTVNSLREEFAYIRQSQYPSDIECSLFKMDCYLGWLEGIVKDNVHPSAPADAENG